MTVTDVPCALCEERVYLDEPHVEIEVEYVPKDERPEQYVAHRQCIANWNEPVP